MKALQSYFIAGLVLLLLGCGINPTVVPKTPAQTAIYTYGLYTTVTNTAADMLIAKTITKAQAQDIQAKLAPFRQTLDAAHALALQGLAIPQTQLEALKQAQTLLLEIQRELQAQQEKKGVTT